MPEPEKTILKQAIEQLPQNQAGVQARTDGASLEATASVQKTWSNGWGLGAYVKGMFGHGRKSPYEAGVQVTKEFDQ